MIFETLRNRLLRYFPRYTATRATLLGKKISIADAPSFLFMQKEIFRKEVFRFNTGRTAPFIIDAGANIGLATIYFKQLYPQAKVLAFEPDPRIFSLLQSNVQAFRLQDVTLVNKALSNRESFVSFHTEGVDAGRIMNGNGHDNIIQVPATLLSGYLNETVDFLKIDIEGAETDVLPEIRDKLHYVSRIFIEYHSFVNTPQRLDELINILTESGFRIYIDSPGLSSVNPFVHVQTYLDMDMQLNIYAIRQ